MIKKQNKFPKMKIPGEILEKHIKFDIPEIDGVYLCFYKPYPPLAHDSFPMAGLKISHFRDNTWSIKDQVLAWIGPLPILSLDELTQNQDCVRKCFSIGTLKDAAKGTYKLSNFPQYIFAYLNTSEMKKGNFIFELNSHKSVPVPLSKFNEKKRKWEEIKEPKKYIITIKKLKG